MDFIGASKSTMTLVSTGSTLLALYPTFKSAKIATIVQARRSFAIDSHKHGESVDCHPPALMISSARTRGCQTLEHTRYLATIIDYFLSTMAHPQIY